jgi:hypothetical protein
MDMLSGTVVFSSEVLAPSAPDAPLATQGNSAHTNPRYFAG